MMKPRFAVNCLAALVALCALSSITCAYDGCSNGAWFNAPAFGTSGSLYGLGYVPVPPYYAMHPPVYYGERYYRTYGESPFARTDYSSRPHRIQAELVINPFVSQALVGPPAAAAPAPVEPKPVDTTENKDQVTVSPQMIINPFYQPEAKVVRRD
jgi:hypothetical protein